MHVETTVNLALRTKLEKFFTYVSVYLPYEHCGSSNIIHSVFAASTSQAPTTTQAPHCPSGWLHCQNSPSGICIRVEWLCDGVTNCPQSWDEQPQNCPSINLFIFVFVFS